MMKFLEQLGEMNSTLNVNVQELCVDTSSREDEAMEMRWMRRRCHVSLMQVIFV